MLEPEAILRLIVVVPAPTEESKVVHAPLSICCWSVAVDGPSITTLILIVTLSPTAHVHGRVVCVTFMGLGTVLYARVKTPASPPISGKTPPAVEATAELSSSCVVTESLNLVERLIPTHSPA